MKINLLRHVHQRKWKLFERAADALETTPYKQIYGFMFGANPFEACAMGACYDKNPEDNFTLHTVMFIVDKKMTGIAELNDDYKLTFKEIAAILRAASKGEEYYELNQTESDRGTEGVDSQVGGEVKSHQ